MSAFTGGFVMVEIGQWVLYGVHGICRVIGTEKQLVNRKRTEYLVLEPFSKSESRFYLPTGNPTALAKLKEVLTAGEMEALLEANDTQDVVWIDTESLRRQYYKDLLSAADRSVLIKMVTYLYRYREAQFAAGKKFHQCDDNFLRDAEKVLASEFALVMDKTLEEARNFLREKLK